MMKKLVKRMVAGLLALLTVIGTSFSGAGEVSAASASANLKMWYASNKEHGVITEFNSYSYTGNIMYAMIDGHTAYCMNYTKSADGGQTMYSYEDPHTSMSAAQEKQLSYCMYYGHSKTAETSPSTAERNEYIGTQAMVWVIVNNLFGTASGDSAANKVCACAPDANAAYNYYVNLRNQIQASYNVTVPSFASTTKSGAPTYELKWNAQNGRFETTLTDNNGSLSNFNFSASGYSTSRNGNQLTIYTKNVNTTTSLATMATNNGVVEPTSSAVYWYIDKAKYQEFVSDRPQVDPVSAYIRVKTESIGYGTIIKEDEESGVKLPKAVYGIYSDSGCKTLVDTLTTNESGTATSKGLVAGTYYVKEITAPKGYVLSDEVHTLTISAGQTTTFTVKDTEQLGRINIFKAGEVLTGWNGSNFVYETVNLQGASFKVTAGADIYQADGTKVFSKGDVIAEKLTTGADGKVVLSDLHLGTYVVTEVEGILGYTINTEPHEVEVAYVDQSVSVQIVDQTVRNTRQRAEVSAVKLDSDTENPLDGGQFTLYAGNDIVSYYGEVLMSKGAAIQTVTTDANGKAAFTVDIPINNEYFVKETLAPEGYLRNSEDVYHFAFNYLPETSESISFAKEFENDRVTAKIKLQKVDAENKAPLSQGDASLEGAVYGLYARNTIYHPDGATGVLFYEGDLVATLRTDKHGKAQVDGLFLGNYYVKEITASEGYLLDEAEHDLVCDYEGDLVAEVVRSTVSDEVVKRQPFMLIKISDDGEQTDANLLQGAGFTVYLKSSIPLKKDGSYDFDKATPVISGNDGETELFSDETGCVISAALPYGTYVVVETTVPHNMASVKPFEVRITEHAPTTPQVWRILIDREFTAKLRIVKMDADTKMPVLLPNTEFKIFDVEKNEYVKMVTTYPSKVTHTSFFTDEDGDLILPNALRIGTYRIEEVSAPYGYVINQQTVTVEVDSNTFYQVDPDTNDAIITVYFEDEPTVGELTIYKKGEMLEAYRGGLFASTWEKQFVYKERFLAGAVFEIYANEDIFTADMQLDEDGNRTKYYAKDELVATVTTNEEGKAVLSDLPLGTYRIKEVSAPYGFVLNSKEQVVTLSYVNDTTPVVFESATVLNGRQKVSMQIHKLDSDSKEAVEGAVFGLYAETDILNADGKVIVEAGTLLEKAISDKEGLVKFTKDYPFSTYLVKELEALEGYDKSEETITFKAEYQGQETDKTKYEETVYNTKLPVEEPEITSPKTGDDSDYLLYGGIALSAFVLLSALLVGKKKDKKSK